GDAQPKAITALEARSTWDAQAFKAAWNAALRGAAWGPKMLRGALSDPSRADLAASAMGRADPHLAPYVPDLEASLQRLSASLKNFNISSTLASAGVPAHDAIVRRLPPPATPGAT